MDEEKKKRSTRRFKSENAFIRRMNKWIEDILDECGKRKTYAEKKKMIFDGEMFTFLHNTGKPCSCAGCSSKKYKRKKISKRKIDDEIEGL